MPELPEVETVVRSLSPYISGQRIEFVEIRLARIYRGGCPAGRIIRAVSRHGKFILLSLDPSGFLIVHLGMTGKLRWNVPAEKHTHAIFTLSDGVLTYTDARTFGCIELAEQVPERVAKLGPDALLIPKSEFTSLLKSRTGKIKARLLNQLFVRGLGNIYADEALFRAGIHPLAIHVTNKKAEALHEAIQQVLTESIAARGSSISDYVDAANQKGSFQTSHRVYGRTGEPCVICCRSIRRIVISQRSSHYCPKCQKR